MSLASPRNDAGSVHVEKSFMGNNQLSGSMLFYRTGPSLSPGAGDYITEKVAIDVKATSPRAVIGKESRFDDLSHIAYKKTQPLQHRQDAARI